jgi:DNA-3-methyladenine glycosylase
MTRRLPRSFYERDTLLTARELLGKLLVRHVDGVARIGRIVEVEAYLGPHDLASHSSRGRTPRTTVMFGPPGFAYVYMIYGLHFCMNIVTEPEGRGTAVLLRAIEPVMNIADRTAGPALLCKAMAIDKRMNGHDLLSEDFHIADAPAVAAASIVRRPRIGVDYAGRWAQRLLRFYVKGNRYVSRI